MTARVADRPAPGAAVSVPRPLFGLDPAVLRTSVLGALAIVLLAVVIPVHADRFDLGGLARSALLTAVLLPLVLRVLPPGRWMVVLACALALAPVAATTLANITAHDHVRARNHDGGVFLTLAVAHDAVAGRNPYAADHTAALPAVWNPLGRVAGHDVTNPLVRHYPYLPGWFLVQAPFVAATDALGLGWDPRLLGLVALAATAIVVARRPGRTWVNAAVVLALGTSFTTLYASWGTNDAVVGALVLLGVLLAARRPRTAGLILALAISGKFLVGIAVVPLAVVVFRRDGWHGLRRWWTLPAALVATCLPFLLADPGAFVEDTLLFNLGATKLRYPTSGLGLPVLAPGPFHGPVLAATTLVLGAGALVVSAVMAWHWARYEVVPLATAVGVAGILVPARTFQQPYLTLLVVLAGGAWLLADPSERMFPPQVAASR